MGVQIIFYKYNNELNFYRLVCYHLCSIKSHMDNPKLFHEGTKILSSGQVVQKVALMKVPRSAMTAIGRAQNYVLQNIVKGIAVPREPEITLRGEEPPCVMHPTHNATQQKGQK